MYSRQPWLDIVVTSCVAGDRRATDGLDAHNVQEVGRWAGAIRFLKDGTKAGAGVRVGHV